MTSDWDTPTSDPGDDPDWEARLHYWRRKLGRLRLGVEPIDEQIARYRRATLMLTTICFALALMFLALFSAFQRPDVGFVVVVILLMPVVAFAWLDFAVLRLRADRFARDFRKKRARRQTDVGTKTPEGT